MPSDQPEAQPVQWLESVYEVTRDSADALGDELLERGAMSVLVDDADADTPDERPVFGEPGMPAPVVGWDRSRLSVLTASDADVDAWLREACLALAIAVPAVQSRRPVFDQDWVRLTQAQFEPIEVGHRLLICPSWRTAHPDQEDRIRLTIDPGLAFGTGSHATTHLCLQWLEENLVSGQTVLDYGCGSGILAISAAKLGAGAVHGLDIDPLAIVAAAENARLNGVQAQWLGPDDHPESADIVVANILASPLKVLAPLLEDLVHAGGSLVLAGLLDHQVDEVAACYHALSMRPWRAREGWTCLVGTRAPAS